MSDNTNGVRRVMRAIVDATPDPPIVGSPFQTTGGRQPKRGSRFEGPLTALGAALVVLVVLGASLVAIVATTSGSDVSEAIAEHPVTLVDGTELTISFPVAEGSDRGVLWGARLLRGAYEESYAAAPFSALVHIWLDRSADDVEQELREVEVASGSAHLTDNRYIIDRDGHAYDFQFGGSTGPDLPPEILDQWLSALKVEPRPDSVIPIVTISDEYEVTYGPQHSIEGTDIDGAPVAVGITEGCEVEPGASIEHTSDTRSSLRSCILDGRIELLISGSPSYIERIRELDVVQIAGNP